MRTDALAETRAHVAHVQARDLLALDGANPAPQPGSRSDDVHRVRRHRHNGKNRHLDARGRRVRVVAENVAGGQQVALAHQHPGPAAGGEDRVRGRGHVSL
jgi:hypothetical protein